MPTPSIASRLLLTFTLSRGTFSLRKGSLSAITLASLVALTACGGTGDATDSDDDAADSADDDDDDGFGDDDDDEIAQPSCPEPCASDLLPLGEGLRWEYEKVSGQGSPCGDAYQRTNGTHEVTDEGTIIPLLTDCAEVENNIQWRHAPDGHIYSRWQTQDWRRYIKLPPVDGDIWEVPFATITWEQGDSVTVPAGTFSGCWRHVANSGQFVSTYCEHVGLVREERSGGIDYVLVNKNF
jgi:hypothetical protein